MTPHHMSGNCRTMHNKPAEQTCTPQLHSTIRLIALCVAERKAPACPAGKQHFESACSSITHLGLMNHDLTGCASTSERQAADPPFSRNLCKQCASVSTPTACSAWGPPANLTRLHLIHVNGLQHLPQAEDDGMILVFRLAFAQQHACITAPIPHRGFIFRQLDPVTGVIISS